jgi:hypothetical protein
VPPPYPLWLARRLAVGALVLGLVDVDSGEALVAPPPVDGHVSPLHPVPVDGHASLLNVFLVEVS